jgi:hypothetical protein
LHLFIQVPVLGIVQVLLYLFRPKKIRFPKRPQDAEAAAEAALQSDDSLMDDVENIDFGIHNDNNNNDGNDENDGRMSGFIFF